MSLQHALLHQSYGSYHPPTAPAPEKTRNCGLLQLQELMTTVTLFIIVGDGVAQNRIHAASSFLRAWVSSQGCTPLIIVIVISCSCVVLGCFIPPRPLHEQGLMAVVG